jgi:ATP-dependent Clp endopeptidase proteolytic subunit ClpP
MIKVNESKREIYLYDAIGPSYVGMIGADDFVEALNMFSGQDVTVRINSPGGSVDEGLAIYNLMKNHNGKVRTVVDGVAASIASIILLGGSERVAAKQSTVMIHNPWTVVGGDAKALRKTADTLDTYTENLVGVYADRTGKAEDAIRAAMDNETWMTSKQALEENFISSIDEPAEKVDAAIVPKGMFTNTPQMYLKPEIRLQLIKERPQVGARAKAFLEWANQFK